MRPAHSSPKEDDERLRPVVSIYFIDESKAVPPFPEGRHRFHVTRVCSICRQMVQKACVILEDECGVLSNDESVVVTAAAGSDGIGVEAQPALLDEDHLWRFERNELFVSEGERRVAGQKEAVHDDLDGAKLRVSVDFQRGARGIHYAADQVVTS